MSDEPLKIYSRTNFTPAYQKAIDELLTPIIEERMKRLGCTAKEAINDYFFGTETQKGHSSPPTEGAVNPQ